MTNADELAHRLAGVAKRMNDDNVPPYEVRQIALSQGELNMIVRALVVLSALRGAIESK